MKIKRSQVSSSKKLTTQITRIWAQDGWCYIPELSQRHRFFAKDDCLEFDCERWHGIIPMPEHRETLHYSVHALQPLIWQEEGQGWSELYEEVVPNHSKTTTCQTPPPQPTQLHP